MTARSASGALMLRRGVPLPSQEPSSAPAIFFPLFLLLHHFCTFVGFLCREILVWSCDFSNRDSTFCIISNSTFCYDYGFSPDYVNLVLCFPYKFSDLFFFSADVLCSISFICKICLLLVFVTFRNTVWVHSSF